MITMPPQIIILEGTDGTGKTSLARELEKKGYWYYHASAPTHDHYWAEYIEPVEEGLKYGRKMVLDRWHLGEWVWPQIFGRQSLFEDVQTFMACHGFLIDMGAVVFIMQREMDEIVTELRARGEKSPAINDAIRGYIGFNNLIGRALPNVVAASMPTARVLLGLETVVRGGDGL